MNIIQRITKNFAVLLISQTIVYILGFFFVMYTARYLGTEGFGVLSFAIAFTGIFNIFTDLGLNTLIIREVSKDVSLAQKYLGNIAVMKIILVAITFGLLALAINLMGYPKETIIVVYLVGLAVIFYSFDAMFTSIFRAHEKMEYQSAGLILRSGLMLIGTLIIISRGLSIIEFGLLYLLVSTIVLSYSFGISIWKFTKPKIEVDWEFWKKIIKEAWPMGGMAICIMIYFRIDTVMLSLMKGDVAVGLYNAAYRLSESSTVIPAIFMSAVFPLLSKYHERAKSSFVRTYEKSVKYLLYLALPMAVVITFLAQPIVNLIFGSEFSGSAVALQVLIWASAVMYVTMVLGTTLVTANKQMFGLKVNIITVILNIIMNVFMISRYSYVGAAITTIISEVFGLIIGIYYLNRWGYKLNMKNIFLPPLLGLSVAGVASIILITMNVNVLIISLIFILLYGMIVYKTGIKEDDKELIRNIFNVSKVKGFRKRIP